MLRLKEKDVILLGNNAEYVATYNALIKKWDLEITVGKTDFVKGEVAMLLTSRNRIKQFRNLDTLSNMLNRLGVKKFSTYTH